MEYFKQWTICVCISLILAVIFSSFEPEGKMKSFCKLLVGLFVFVSFIYPLKDIKIMCDAGNVKMVIQDGRIVKDIREENAGNGK